LCGCGRAEIVFNASQGSLYETLRAEASLDDEILEWFRQQAHEAGGGNYQTLINETFKSRYRFDDQTGGLPIGIVE
jgi:hypothetical protein